MAASNPYAPRRSVCVWAGRELDLRVLPVTAHPAHSPRVATMPGGGQADFLLAALAARGAQAAPRLNCTAGAAAGRGAARLVVAQYWNWHDAALSGHLGPVGLERVRAHYGALAEALVPAGARALLMAASEWAVGSTLAAVGRVLANLSVPAARTCLVHFNHGVMRGSPSRDGCPDGCSCGGGGRSVWAPLRAWERARGLVAPPGGPRALCQAYWHSNLWLLASQRRPKPASGEPALCTRRPATRRLSSARGTGARRVGAARAADPAARRDAPGRASDRGFEPAVFVMLGGKPRFGRGLVMLDLWRRGMLRPPVARWSGSRYAFCDEPTADAPAWAGQHGQVQVRSDPGVPAPGWPAPYSLDEQRDLLSDAPAVAALCAALPRVLDLPPSFAAGVFASAAGLWRGVRFALTFESDMAALDSSAELAFLTEKSFKPLQHGLPLLMLGSPGTLAQLRSLGFRSFSPAINESYDDQVDGRLRLQAVLQEAERLVALPDEAWRQLRRPGGPLDAAIRHNERHLGCGALRRVLAGLAGRLLAPVTQPCQASGADHAQGGI